MPCNADGSECTEDESKALFTLEKHRMGGYAQNLIGMTGTAQTWSIYEGFTDSKIGFGQNEAMKKNQRYKACSHWGTTYMVRCFKTCDKIKCRKRKEIKQCNKEIKNDCIAAMVYQKLDLSFVMQGANDKFKLEVFEGQDAMLMATIAMAIDRRNDEAQRDDGEGLNGKDAFQLGDFR